MIKFNTYKFLLQAHCQSQTCRFSVKALAKSLQCLKRWNFEVHTNGTFAFAQTHKASPSAKSKEPFFSQRTKLNIDIYEIK
ncbi:MAG: hypothetical protein WCS03_07970 [Bacteroidota bacterium]